IMADRAKDFFTETASMRTLTFPSSDQVDWGFRVGVSLVALFAITEISALGYHFVGARMARRAAAPAVVASATTPAPVAPSTAASAAPLTTAAPVAPSTAPAPSTATVSPADRLLQEARTLRERGDTTTAL